MINEGVYVSDIQRYSVHDGPGIRTVVFFLGCPLRCEWCHNPETSNPKPQLMMNHQLCARCDSCMNICPNNAIYISELGQIATDKKKCNNCFKCIDECYYNARQLTGRYYTVEEVFNEVKKDKIIYKNTCGGITLSGGEPTLYPDFCNKLLKKFKMLKINTAIETCGYCDFNNFEKMINNIDLFLYDFKLFDMEKHKKYTGVDNKIILQNLKKLLDHDKKVIIRIPLIPGVNDDVREFTNILNFIRELKKINEIHIMPFHQIGSLKYDMLEIDYKMRNIDEENNMNIDKCKSLAEGMGFKVNIGGSGFKEDINIYKEGIQDQIKYIYKN